MERARGRSAERDRVLRKRRRVARDEDEPLDLVACSQRFKHISMQPCARRVDDRDEGGALAI
eukprot:3482291-Pleurochrysis_carterae.AAC.2